MADRILIEGGHLITMDPEVGDQSPGDVLIEDDTIAQVGAVVISADVSNVDTVPIDGEVKKRHGALGDVDVEGPGG